ncbi:MAG: TPM domain-containing protein [Myxococcaceae bacterium]|nr:MAG: TPM domain-containing protein [Myxococcaceae bacterium]
MVKAVLLSLLLPTLLLGVVPTLTRPVTDQTETLSARETETVAQALVKLREERQVQMAVLLVESTNGQPIEDYAEEVFRVWKGGEKGRDNGLLLVIAKGDRRSRLEVGYGLEPSLTDGESQALLHAQGPLMREGRFAEALLGIISSVREELPTGAGPPAALDFWKPAEVRGFFFTLLVFAFVAGGLLVQCRLSALRGASMPVVAVMLVLVPPSVLVSIGWSSQLSVPHILVVYGVMLALCSGGWFVTRGKNEALGIVMLISTVLGFLAVTVLLNPTVISLQVLLTVGLFVSMFLFLFLGLIVAMVKGIGASGSGGDSSSGWTTSSSSSSSDWSSSSSSYDSSSSFSSSDSSSSSSDWSGGGGSSGGGGGSDSW